MKHILLIMMVAIVFMSCQQHCPNPNTFFYNANTGKCENCTGEVGYNTLNYDEVRATKNAECVDLSNINLVYLLDTASIDNFHPFGYNILDGYNFKGALFDSSQLFFNHIYNASFEGADLRNLQYGYAYVKGKMDGNTLLPLSGTCTTPADSCDCVQ